MHANIRQMKIKNCPDYLFHGNMIINIKDFDSSLLEINKLSFKSVFSLNIYYIKYIPTRSLDHVNVDNDDNNKDFPYLFLDNVGGHNEKNNRNKRLFFTSTERKGALKITEKCGKKLKDNLK